MKTQSVVLGVLAIWAGFVALLAVVPWSAAPEPDASNVAALLGYDISLAYLLVAGWAAVALVVTAIVAARHPGPLPDAPSNTPLALPIPRRIVECVLVGAGALVLYWPYALARLGPHIEDVYFLNVLWRMQCGAVPYTDFEFLYGPLMIGPLGLWTKMVGFSMPAYYAYYAGLQVALAVVLMAILQAHVPRHWQRYVAFLLLVPFVFDLLYGLNWTAWRYFGVVLVLLVLAKAPTAPRKIALAAVITGLQAAYSYEYGIAMMLAGITVIALDLFAPGRGRAVLGIVGYTVASVAVWAGVSVMMTGAGFTDYLSLTRLVGEMATANGLGQFAFFWTAHSLSLFLLLAVAILLAGLALSRLLGNVPNAADRQLAGALIFALIALKIALQRADFLHLVVPFVPLMLFALINAPRRLAQAPVALQTLAFATICVAALAQMVAYAPWAGGLLRGTKGGWQHELSGRPTIGPIEARNATMNADRSYLNADVRALAKWLASPAEADRPVLFYRSTWGLPPQVGVCPEGYAYYDLLYSDSRAPLADLVKSTPDLLVVMTETDWNALALPPKRPNPELSALNGLRQIAQYVGSAHYAQSPIENSGIEEQMWRVAVGNDIAAGYAVLGQVGRYVVLGRNDP